MPTDYDAVIIGAGHNGLVTANYLARAGKSVLVLEARDLVGGANTDEHPDAAKALPKQHAASEGFANGDGQIGLPLGGLGSRAGLGSRLSGLRGE